MHGSAPKLEDKVQSFKTLKQFKPFNSPYILHRGAGERGGGLNGAKRLNSLNVWNFVRTFSPAHSMTVISSIGNCVVTSGPFSVTTIISSSLTPH